MNSIEEINYKEYEFLKLYLAIKKIRKECFTLDEKEFTKDLVNYYSNPNYSFLFEDILKKKSMTDMNIYVDLHGAFEIAMTYGLLIKEDAIGSKYIVNNMSFHRIMNILKKHSKEEVTAMYMMISEMKRKEVINDYYKKLVK